MIRRTRVPSATAGIFWVAAVIFSLDQWTKYLACHFLESPRTLVPGFMYLTVVYNDGAAWSLLAGHRFLLTALAPGTLLLGIFFRRYLGLNRAINRFSLGLIAGGICGNFLDRLRTGYVVDFIDVRLPFYRWPTFNVADSALCLGAFLFLVANQRPPAPADQLPKK